jgi:hypothetical protein
MFLDIGYAIDATASGPQILAELYKDNNLAKAVNLHTTENFNNFNNLPIKNLYTILLEKCRILFNENYLQNKKTNKKLLYLSTKESDYVMMLNKYIFENQEMINNSSLQAREHLQQLNNNLLESSIEGSSNYTYFDRKIYQKYLSNPEKNTYYNNTQAVFIEQYLKQYNMDSGFTEELGDIICYYYFNSTLFDRDKMKRLVVPAVYGQTQYTAANVISELLILSNFNLNIRFYNYKEEEINLMVNSKLLDSEIIYYVATQICTYYYKVCETEFPALVKINQLFHKYSKDMLLTRGLHFVLPDGCEVVINNYETYMVQINNSVMKDKDNMIIKRKVFTLKEIVTYLNTKENDYLPVQNLKSLRRGIPANIVHSLDATIARCLIKFMYEHHDQCILNCFYTNRHKCMINSTNF